LITTRRFGWRDNKDISGSGEISSIVSTEKVEVKLEDDTNPIIKLESSKMFQNGERRVSA
jgi:hypothetical protein